MVGWHKELDPLGKIWDEMAKKYNRAHSADTIQNVSRERILWSSEIFDLAFMMPLSPLLINSLMTRLPHNTPNGMDPIDLPAEAAELLQQQ
jgi:hypothetical protein